MTTATPTLAEQLATKRLALAEVQDALDLLEATLAIRKAQAELALLDRPEVAAQKLTEDGRKRHLAAHLHEDEAYWNLFHRTCATVRKVRRLTAEIDGLRDVRREREHLLYDRAVSAGVSLPGHGR
jgi:hypothetical protein